MSTFWAFLEAATVMCAWVGVALVIAFIGRFCIELVADLRNGQGREW